MRILIVNPPPPKESVIKGGRKRPPLSLAWIASILREEGNFVEIFDMNALRLRELEIDKKFDWLIITSAPLDRWETPYLDYSEAIKIVKKAKNNGIRTILIGPHGTVTPEQLLKDSPEIDFIVRGEPERTVEEIVSGEIKSKIKGISYFQNGKFFHNENGELIELDELPLPAYDLLPMEKYNYNVKDFPKPFTIMETSRGCPYRCIFCFKAMHGKGYRVRSPEKVIEEIKYLVREFGIKSIYFQDLEFTLNRERVMDICKSIIKNNIKISWACASRVNDVDLELLKTMKKAGCKNISFGVESLSPIILEKIKKGTSLKEIARAYNLCQEAGINFNGFYTVGHPGESAKTVEESFKNAFKYKINYPKKSALVVPYPGTQLFKMAKEKGLIKGENLWLEAKLLRGRIDTGDFERKTLKTWLYYLLIKILYKKL
ncbi:MAG: radical SAM protein [Candidatus Nealsonbacteria bacterium]|nr:radical SAM protein [Candidatus Nealsonbacteria bacterium]